MTVDIHSFKKCNKWYKLQKKKKTSDIVYMNPITENQHQEN